MRAGHWNETVSGSEPETGMKSSVVSHRRYAWLITSVVVVAVVTWQRYTANRYRPDRVLELPVDSLVLKVENGLIFTWNIDRNAYDPNQRVIQYITRPGSGRKIPVFAPAVAQSNAQSGTDEPLLPSQNGSVTDSNPEIKHLYVRPVRGGVTREIRLDSTEAAHPDTIWKSDTVPVQVFLQQPPHPALRSYGGGGASSVRIPLPPPRPIPPYHIEKIHSKTDPLTLVIRQAAPGKNTFTTLRTLPAGTIERTANLNLHRRVAVADGWVYWVQCAPDEVSYRVSANRQFTLLTNIPHCAVMTVSLAGGAPHKVMEGLWEDTQLIPAVNGVLCQTRSGQQGNDSVEGNTHHVTMLIPNQPPRKVIDTHYAQLPAAIHGFIYWIETERSGGINLQVQKYRLMEAREDGSSVRELKSTSLTERSGSYMSSLIVHNDQLYLAIGEHHVQADSANHTFRSSLYRLHPGTVPTFEKVCEEPENCTGYWYDGDTFYCTATETREDMTDFSAAGLIGKSITILYSHPLPK